MSDEAAKAGDLYQRSIPLFEQMGRLASDWALLELLVDECIWRLADVTPVLGACITAQIFTINNRLMALASLMRLRGFPDALVKKIDKFGEAVRKAAERRNRAIHDPVLVAPETGDTGRLEITAQRKPIFAVVPISAESLRKDREEIWKCSRKFTEHRDEIFRLLPTLPKVPESKSFPINLRLILPQQIEADGK